MRSTLRAVLAGALLLGPAAFAADKTDETWTGFISDSHCGATHKADLEHGGKITAKECVIGREGDAAIPGCVSAKYGAKFVFVVGDTVYKVSNQDFAGLRQYAMEPVKLTGALKGDTITVSKIVPAKP